jgi:hypothetical protein
MDTLNNITVIDVDLIDTLPLQEEVCDRCLMAFWRHCIVPILPPGWRCRSTKRTRH